MIGLCFVCGRLLVSAGTKKPVPGVARTVDGNPVRMHKMCAETFDRDNAKTVRPVTDDTGHVIVRGEPGFLRQVYKKPGEFSE